MVTHARSAVGYAKHRKQGDPGRGVGHVWGARWSDRASRPNLALALAVAPSLTFNPTQVRSSFKAQMHVEDPTEISRLKMLAIVGLQNYVIQEWTGKAVESHPHPHHHLYPPPRQVIHEQTGKAVESRRKAKQKPGEGE